jgi:butyryl-CoA dehydrogenase
VKPAVDAFLEAGFLNAARSFEAGGMQLPTLLSQACFAHFQSANAASTSYPFLTMGAANLIESFGTEEQKRRFLQPMIDGRFFGTMALTEPHAGSSLSDIRTRAEPALTAAIGSRATRSSSPAAITRCRKTSCTWCWPNCRTRRPG